MRVPLQWFPWMETNDEGVAMGLTITDCLTPSAAAEDNVELSLSFAVNGVGQDGYATLTEDQADVVHYASSSTGLSTRIQHQILIQMIKCQHYLIQKTRVKIPLK